MAIYYFDGNIIGRSSGRSSVGAAAYRAAEKLCSMAHAAYQSGNELRDGEGEIVHDYTKKGGVVHSEIILPEGAPEKFKDRETLWNAVERAEKRKDAQLAREIIVALPHEFNLHEQIEVMRDYAKENFVDKGMIADVAIHDKGDGNPHAHIMLTTRNVSSDGFGLKNTDWNKKDVFVEWRKNWAEVNNRVFERKEMAERIDYRSYREQGIDREPMIHLGYEAAALERQGIKTERGNHNREVQRRNEQREALKTEHTKETTEKPDAPRKNEKIEQLEKELQKIRQTEKISPHTEKPLEPEPETPFISTLEKQLKAEKAMQYIEKSQSPRDAVKTAQYMHGLKETYVALEKEKIPLMEQHNRDKYEIPKLEYRAELMEEHAKNIETLQSRAAQLQKIRQNLNFLQRTKKQETDAQIAQATQNLEQAQDFFANRFHIDPAQSPAELNRLQQEIRTKQDELNTKQILVQAIRKKQAALELAYHTQKLLNETRPDQAQITQLLEQTHNPPKTVREKLLHEQIDRRLNTITDYSFEKVINNLPHIKPTSSQPSANKPKNATASLKPNGNTPKKSREATKQILKPFCQQEARIAFYCVYCFKSAILIKNNILIQKCEILY